MSTPNLCEVRGVIASKQGLSCSGYLTLASRTIHLRERLYVAVRDGDKLFLPQGREHFPAKELERHYLGRMKLGYYESIGHSGGEIVFTCEGPAADEGATVIAATLAGFEELLTRNLLAREIVAQQQRWYYLKALLAPAPPYRPDVLPGRRRAPEPVTEEERAARPRRAPPSLDEQVRERLAAWGMLEGYEELLREQAAARHRKQAQRSAAPWLQPTTQHFNFGKRF